MDWRVFLCASPRKTQVHGEVSLQPGMQKAENSPAPFQVDKCYETMAGQQKGDQAQSDWPQMQTECEGQELQGTQGRGEQRPAPAQEPVTGRGAGNGTRNRLLMAFTPRSSVQQISNLSHSITDALWWVSLQGNLRTRGFEAKGRTAALRLTLLDIWS